MDTDVSTKQSDVNEEKHIVPTRVFHANVDIHA